MPLYRHDDSPWASGFSAGLASSALRLVQNSAGRTTPRRVDQAHRHVQFLVQFTSEEISHRGEAGVPSPGCTRSNRRCTWSAARPALCLTP